MSPTQATSLSAAALPPAPNVLRAPALVREQVADYLREAITSLSLPAGTPLVEREICELTTASRTTVREVLRQLEAEGLAESVPGRGVLVKQLSRKEVEDMYVVRAQLEGLASKLFAEKADEYQKQELREAFNEMALTVESPMTMLERKGRFYEVLRRGADNLELEEQLLRIQRRVKLTQANSLALPGRPVQSLREIEGLLDAIEAGDGELARVRCIEHIEAAAEALVSQGLGVFG